MVVNKVIMVYFMIWFYGTYYFMWNAIGTGTYDPWVYRIELLKYMECDVEDNRIVY